MNLPSAVNALTVQNLTVGYGHVGVLRDVSLHVPKGSIVALLGGNGAGKSTTLRAISGLLRPESGRILFENKDFTGASPEKIVNAGVLHVAEGRRLFRTQTVRDNLELGLYNARLDRATERQRFQEVFSMFPVLLEKQHLRAGLLSGGQQQMLAIGQALVRKPHLLLLDEPSLGLAPILVDQVLEAVVAMRARGTTILIVEQMIERALEIADYAFVLSNGAILGQGAAAEIAGSDLVKRAYLGAT